MRRREESVSLFSPQGPQLAGKSLLRASGARWGLLCTVVYPSTESTQGSVAKECRWPPLSSREKQSERCLLKSIKCSIDGQRKEGRGGLGKMSSTRCHLSWDLKAELCCAAQAGLKLLDQSTSSLDLWGSWGYRSPPPRPAARILKTRKWALRRQRALTPSPDSFCSSSWTPDELSHRGDLWRRQPRGPG